MIEPGVFRNSLLCEDVRDEIGNKKSLMVVISGDIFVPTFPATFRVAFYFEYVNSSPMVAHDLAFIISLPGEDTAATGSVAIHASNDPVTSIVIPQGMVTFHAPGELVVRIGPEGKLSRLIQKKVLLQPV